MNIYVCQKLRGLFHLSSRFAGKLRGKTCFLFLAQRYAALRGEIMLTQLELEDEREVGGVVEGGRGTNQSFIAIFLFMSI